MKFGKQLEVVRNPRFREHYIQYKELKKAIKVFAGQERDQSTVEEVTQWTTSFLRLGTNPEPVSPEKRLRGLVQQELERVSRCAENEEETIRSNLNQLEADCQRLGGQRETLWLRIEDLGDKIVELKVFAQLNFTGFRKILKKYDKWSHSSVLPWFMAHVLRARLMCVDYDQMLQALNRSAQAFRKQYSTGETSRQLDLPAAEVSDQRSRSVFFVDQKDTMRVKVELAKHLAAGPSGLPALRGRPEPKGGGGALQARVPRSRTHSVFLDTGDFSIYRSLCMSPSDDPIGSDEGLKSTQAGSPSVSSSFHVRCTDEEEALHLVHDSLRGRTEVILTRAEVKQIFGGLGASVELSRRLESLGVAAQEALQAVRQTVGGEHGLQPMAQASFVRSIFNSEGSGGVRTNVVFDEDVRMAPFQDWDSFSLGKGSQHEVFPYNIFAISSSQPGMAEEPTWLRNMYDSANLSQVSNFSKAAHAVAHFRAKSSGLQAPHWCRKCLGASGAEDPESDEAGEPAAESRAEGQTGVGAAALRAADLNIGSLSDPTTAVTRSEPSAASRTPTAGLPVAATAVVPPVPARVEESGGGLVDRRAFPDTVRVPAAPGGLEAPLLSAQAPEPSRLPPCATVLSEAKAAVANASAGGTLGGGGIGSGARDAAIGPALGDPADIGVQKPVRRTIVTVQPKTLYSNERTFLEWIHFATILAALGIVLLHTVSDKVMLGRFLVLSAIFLVARSLCIFNRRARALDLKEATDYEDNWGPPALILSLLGAMCFASLQALGSHE